MVLYNHPDHCSELNKQNRRKNVYDDTPVNNNYSIKCRFLDCNLAQEIRYAAGKEDKWQKSARIIRNLKSNFSKICAPSRWSGQSFIHSLKCSEDSAITTHLFISINGYNWNKILTSSIITQIKENKLPLHLVPSNVSITTERIQIEQYISLR